MRKMLSIGLLATLLLAACGEKKVDPTKTNPQDSLPAVKTNPGDVKKTNVTDGEFTETYPDGKIKIKGEMKNGTRFGTWVAFYPDGVKQSESYYEDGKKNGKTATFYKSGKLRYVGYYRWDEPTGTWEFYNEDGSLATTKEYKN